MLTQQKTRCGAEIASSSIIGLQTALALLMFLVSSAHIANSSIADPALCL